jgi:cell division protein FtsW
VVSIITIGVIMIFSASSATSQVNYSDPYYFLKRQTIWVLIGIIFMIIAFRADLEKLQKYSLLGIFVSVILLIMVIIPGIGIEVMGARRWLGIGPISFQPAEVAKYTMIFYLADMASRHKQNLMQPAKMFPSLLILGIVIFLIEEEPDLGTSLVVGGIYLIMIYMAGVRKRYIFTMVSVGVGFVIYRIFSEGYRMRRFAAFVDPWKDPLDTGYQIVQSLIAIGSGGILGLGVGQSRQKFFYLPEQHTDFIFAILGEELGLFGTLTVVLLFLGVVYRGFKIAINTKNVFFKLLAGGISFMFAFQFFINVGVVTAVLPTTGIPLPFISFGGTSLVFNMGAIGALLNIYNKTNIAEEEGRKMLENNNA